MRRTYKFSGGSLHVDVPSGWREVSGDTAISFSSPSGGAALTVTVYDEPRLSVQDVERINAESHPFGIPSSERRSLPVSSGSGFAQEFRKMKEEGESHWIAHFLFFDHATVIGSVNGPPEEMRLNAGAFEVILGGIECTFSA